MTYVRPCPICGEIPTLLCDNATVTHGCFKGMAFNISFWNERGGEAEKMCGKCKHAISTLEYGVFECGLCKDNLLRVYDSGCDRWERK